MATWDCYDGTGYRLGSVKADDLDDAFVVADDTFDVTPAHIEPAEDLDLDLDYEPYEACDPAELHYELHYEVRLWDY